MKRTARQIGSWLILLGLIGLFASLSWWQQFYSQLIGSAPVECLYALSGSCQMVSDVVGLFGVATYDARLLWVSGIAVILGVGLQR